MNVECPEDGDGGQAENIGTEENVGKLPFEILSL